jgi:hypothetical protein
VLETSSETSAASNNVCNIGILGKPPELHDYINNAFGLTVQQIAANPSLGWRSDRDMRGKKKYSELHQP